MAKPTKTAPEVEAVTETVAEAVTETVVEPQIVELPAEDRPVGDPGIAPTKEDLLVSVLGEMNHDDPGIWDEDGKPNLAYLTKNVGQPVTREEVDAIDSTFKRTPATEEEERAKGALDDVAVELPPEAPKPRVYTHEDLKAVDKEWAEALAVKHKAEQALKAIEAKRDPIVNALAHNPNGQSFAHVVQEMQKRTQETAMARVGAVKEFQKITGGVVPSMFPSKLDERAATRRSVQRRAARDAG